MTLFKDCSRKDKDTYISNTFIGDTCNKSTCTGGLWIRSAYIGNICTKNTCIGSTFSSSPYVGNACTQGICIGNIDIREGFIRDVCIGNTYIEDARSICAVNHLRIYLQLSQILKLR